MAAGGVAGIVEGDPQMVVPRGIQLQFPVPDQIGGEFGDVHHLRGAGIFEPRPRDRRNRLLEEIGGAVHRVHVLWMTRHMWPHSPPRIHLTPSRFASA